MRLNLTSIFCTKELKKNNDKLKIIGYMHTVIPPLPLDYIKREGHPDLLLVNGIDQKNILCQKLGWKKMKSKILPLCAIRKIII